ncbi:MAG: hypothetical protein FJ405_19210, partial [Verrucomicrobia bacterium]|nr:hypothetical protein [Verrucomicrobiota bacterium]
MNAVFRLPVSPLSWGFLFLFLLLPLAATAQDKAIRLRNETILTPPAPPPGARRPALQDAANVSGLYLIQFQNRYQPEFANELTALGVRLAVYVPEDTFIARLQNASLERIRSLPFVRWVGEFKPNHKLHSAIADWAANPGGEASRTLNLMISPAASPIERALVRRLLQRLDRQAQGRFGGLLQGSVLRTQLGALAASPAILWVEPAPNPKLVDEVAAKIVAGDGGAGRLAMQELGFDGTGVTVAVADSGLDTGDLETMHPDIAGRVAGLFFYGNLEDASDGHSHGTHVTGIVAGNAAVGETDENGFLYGLGVAPGATVVAQRLFDDAGGYEAPSSFETLTRDAVRAGADIGSNSWGDDVQGRYDISAAEFDALVRDADSLSAGDQEYILEFSAGNAGPGAQTIGSPAVAKNVIATGASQNDRLD